MNIWVIIKQESIALSLTWRFVVCIYTEDPTSSNISFSQSLIQNKALNIFNSMKTKRDEEIWT